MQTLWNSAIGGDIRETLKMGDSIVLLLELKDPDTGNWPRGLDGKTWMYEDEARDGAVRQDSGIGDGVVGLYNMG